MTAQPYIVFKLQLKENIWNWEKFRLKTKKQWQLQKMKIIITLILWSDVFILCIAKLNVTCTKPWFTTCIFDSSYIQRRFYLRAQWREKSLLTYHCFQLSQLSIELVFCERHSAKFQDFISFPLSNLLQFLFPCVPFATKANRVIV